MQIKRTTFIMVLVLVLTVSLANATTNWNTDIPAGRTSTMTINLQSGQKVKGSFNISGYHYQVKFWIRDPTGTIILDSGMVTSNATFEFTASQNGAYVLNFDNSESSHNKLVYVSYGISAAPVLGLDPIVFIVIVLVVIIVLAILAFALYRRSRNQRKGKQPPPPPSNTGTSA